MFLNMSIHTLLQQNLFIVSTDLGLTFLAHFFPHMVYFSLCFVVEVGKNKCRVVVSWERQAILVEVALELVKPGLELWRYMMDLGHLICLL